MAVRPNPQTGRLEYFDPGISLLGNPVTIAHGGTNNTSFLNGSVIFYNSTGIKFDQDNSNFFWDRTNKFLGIGTNTPISRMHVAISESNAALFNNIAQEGLRYQNIDTTANNWTELIFANAGLGAGKSSAAIAVQNLSHSTQSGIMVLATGQSGVLTEVVRLTNVGNTFLSVSGDTNTSPIVAVPQEALRIQNNNSTVNNWSEIMFRGQGSNSFNACIAVQNLSHTTRNGRMAFFVGDGSALTEMMRITEASQLLIGQTVASSSTVVLEMTKGLSNFRFINNTNAGVQNPTLSLINTGASGKAGALFADTTGAAFIFDSAGSFDFTSDTHANIVGNTFGSGTSRLRVLGSNGNVGIHAVLTPTAYLHIAAGTATASTAPFKFTAGTNLTTPEAGAIEYDGTNLYFTPSTVRKTVAVLETAQTFSSNQTFSARILLNKGANIASAGDLTLGSDGNTFTITGVTTINAITTSGWTAGTPVILIFSGALTVNHNTAGGAGTAPIKLDMSLPMLTAADTVLQLLYDGSYWQEISRKAA